MFIINYFSLALQLDKTYFYTATVLVQEIQLIVFVTRKKCDSPHCMDTVTARLPSPDWAGRTIQTAVLIIVRTVSDTEYR